MQHLAPEPPPLPDCSAELGDRSLFPDLEPQVYANHAAISPPSSAVRAFVGSALADYARRGVGAYRAWNAQRLRLKERLARLFGGEATDYAFLQNTTMALNAVAICFPWRTGDRVVLFEGEFPTNVTPWQRAAHRYGLRLSFLPVADLARPEGADLDPLVAALKGGTRLVALSAVQFQSGLRAPLEAIAELCHAYGAELCVDAIQACGIVPLDFAGLDYVACGGHKWLMGPEGAGFLYVHPDRVKALEPDMAGWLSHERAADFLFDGPNLLRYDKPIRRRADFLEGGAPNAAGYAGLEASVALIEQLGVQAIYAHVSGWLDALEAGLVARGFRSLRTPDAERQSGILGVLPPDDLSVGALAAGLGVRGVACTTPDGVLRFAPHWPNHQDEVPIVLGAVDEALKVLRDAGS